jgi:predicted aconitase with swiveling domain
VSNNKEAIMIKKTIVILACGALIAPVALAQTRSTHKRQTTATTEQPITVTGTVIKMTTGEGSAASYQPFKTLVVREDRSNTPGSYVLNGPGHVVNKNGEVIQTAIKPGTHLRVYYVNTGDSRIVDHVVVD